MKRILEPLSNGLFPRIFEPMAIGELFALGVVLLVEPPCLTLARLFSRHHSFDFRPLVDPCGMELEHAVLRRDVHVGVAEPLTRERREERALLESLLADEDEGCVDLASGTHRTRDRRDEPA